MINISSIIINDCIFFIKNYFNIVEKKQLFIVLIPILTFSIHACIMPISCDEAWTFNNFTYKGFISTFVDYPLPNNHILYSLITNILYLFFSAIFCLRLPVVIISIITLITTLYTLNRLYNPIISTITTGIMSVLFSTLYYSYLGRGYALVLFIYILTFYLIHKIIKEPSKKIYWIQLTIISIAGLYTNPTFFYASIFNFLFLFYYFRIKYVYYIISSALCIGLFTFILYSPIIFTKGIKVLINNKWVAPISRMEVLERLPNFLFQTIEELTGLNGWLFLILFISIFIILFRKKISDAMPIFIFTFALPPFLLLAHSIIAYSRVFNYYNFLFALLLAFAIYHVFPKLSLEKTVYFVILLQIPLVYMFFIKVKIKEDYALQTNQIINKIYKPNVTYLLSSDLFDTYLYYQFNSNKQKTFKIFNNRNSNLNTDTISTFQYIIVDHTFDQTKYRKPIFKNAYYSIYQNKNQYK